MYSRTLEIIFLILMIPLLINFYSCSTGYIADVNLSNFDTLKEAETSSYYGNYIISLGSFELGNETPIIKFSKLYLDNNSIEIKGIYTDRVGMPLKEVLVAIGQLREYKDKYKIEPSKQIFSDSSGYFHLKSDFNENDKLFFLYIGNESIIYNINKLYK